MPYLKELDLGCHELEADARRRFTNDVRSVCALVTRHIPRTKNQKYKKVLVLCVAGQPRPSPMDQLGVAFVEVQRDIEAFFTLTKLDKQRWALSALEEGTLKVTDSDGLDPINLLGAFRRAEDLGFKNHWRWAHKSRRDRRFRAEVWVEHDLEECRLIGAIVTREGDRVVDEVLISTPPDEWAFDRFLGRIRWVDQNMVVLEDKQGGVVGYLALSSA